MNLIEIENLSVTYRGKRGARVEALKELRLSVAQGEIFGFLGPNGAGKSTTIKALMGLIKPTIGQARLCGVPISDPTGRSRVGFLPENPSFYDFLTGREYLDFVGKSFGMEAQSILRESDRVLALLELTDSANRPIRGYSKGMVQRLGLAQALLHDPDLYVLDEPMSGLDPLGRALVKEIIRDLKGRGKTVFFSTHITSDVELVCDRVGIVVGGRLQLEDSVENVLESGTVGYSVQLKNCSDTVCAGLAVRSKGESVREVYVPVAELTPFLERAVAEHCEIMLVEPQRKDLEAFFLEVVAKGRK
jgi:ABC-2 type transport system ATP-binding protein